MEVPSSALILGAIIVWFVLRWATHRRPLPYPPGPKGYPLVGYVKAVPDPIWKTYADWGRKYGSDVIRYNALGNDIVVVNTLKAANELLDKRSSIYSDRPTTGLVMVRDLAGYGWSPVLAPYHSRLWHGSRRIFQHTLNPQASRQYRSLQLIAGHRLLRRLLESPGGFRKHTRYMVGEVIIRAAYGIDVQDKDDPYIAAAEHGLWIANECMAPGRWLVDIIPILKYVPEWVPGAGFKRQARIWKKHVQAMADVPFALAKSRHDLPSDCAAKVVLDDLESDADDVENFVIKATLGTMYGAGSDTTTTILDTFFLAMTLNPDIRKEAQMAVDRVCRDRLPDFSDYDDIPYVHAIVMECLRWRPALPLAVPHSATQDDQYEGYFIPAKSIVFPNIKAMMLDPETYTNPEQFRPTRFLKHAQDSLDLTVPDPTPVVFGFGRRACPGRWIAYDSLWIAIACALAAFDIAPVEDEDGTPVVPDAKYTDGLISYPEDFECRITPRSAQHRKLVTAAADSEV